MRELANEIERAILLAEPGAPITDDLLSERVQEPPVHRRVERPPASDGRLRARPDRARPSSGPAASSTRAAEELGITYRGLLKKMRRLGM